MYPIVIGNLNVELSSCTGNECAFCTLAIYRWKGTFRIKPKLQSSLRVKYHLINFSVSSTKHNLVEAYDINEIEHVARLICWSE